MATDNTYGLYFPIVLGAGAPVPPSLEDSIDSSLRIILSWLYSKRFFLYTFGSVLYALVNSPNDNTAQTTIRQYVIKSIERWEKRITIQNVKMIRNDEGDALEINIQALIKETNTVYNYTTQI